MQNIWMVPWIEDGMLVSRASTSFYLITVATAMVLGNLSGSLFIWLSAKMKIAYERFYILLFALYVIAFIAVCIPSLSTSYIIWFAFGYFVQGAKLSITLFSWHFPKSFYGRAIAMATFFLFLFAFVFQYLIGYLLDSWGGDGEVYSKEAYQFAFAVVIGINVAGILSFALIRPKRRF